VDILNTEEEARIRELIAANAWPDKWDGTEPRADEMIEEVCHTAGGEIATQKLLPGFGRKAG
jgi:hypothetical protein